MASNDKKVAGVNDLFRTYCQNDCDDVLISYGVIVLEEAIQNDCIKSANDLSIILCDLNLEYINDNIQEIANEMFESLTTNKTIFQENSSDAVVDSSSVASIMNFCDDTQAEENILSSEEEKGNMCDVLTIGQNIQAKYTQDDLWYDASIVELNPCKNEVFVTYTDYGNSEWVHCKNIFVPPKVNGLETFSIPKKLVNDSVQKNTEFINDVLSKHSEFTDEFRDKKKKISHITSVDTLSTVLEHKGLYGDLEKYNCEVRTKVERTCEKLTETMGDTTIHREDFNCTNNILQKFCRKYPNTEWNLQKIASKEKIDSFYRNHNPRIVYHGTTTNADKGIMQNGLQVGGTNGVAIRVGTALGTGVYCSSNTSIAAGYSLGSIYLCLVSTKNAVRDYGQIFVAPTADLILACFLLSHRGGNLRDSTVQPSFSVQPIVTNKILNFVPPTNVLKKKEEKEKISEM